MIQKICPFCKLDSYSAYDDPNWLCPYCGQNIGNSRPGETEFWQRKPLPALKNKRSSSYPSRKRGRGSHLQVVDCQGK